MRVSIVCILIWSIVNALGSAAAFSVRLVSVSPFNFDANVVTAVFPCPRRSNRGTSDLIRLRDINTLPFVRGNPAC